MTTAFEYLNREERRIRIPIFSAAFMLTTSVFIFALLASMSYSARTLEADYAAAARRVENDAQTFIDRASRMLPANSMIAEIEQKNLRHNMCIGGTFSVWTKLFNNIDSALPENSVITAFENTLTSKPIFSAEDRFFRIKIAVSDTEQANALYMKLSELKAFESLSFTPRGDIEYQGRKGISIEIEFKFNEVNE